MELTAGNLIKILEKLDNDTILGTLEYGNDSFRSFSSIKRLIYMQADKSRSGKKYLIINNMGSHFTGKGQQEGLTLIRHFTDENI